MKWYYALIPLLLGFAAITWAGERYNSVIGARDFCVTFETEDQTTGNSTCKPIRVPNRTIIDHIDYYSYIGINWDDLEYDIPSRAINWDGGGTTIPASYLDWSAEGTTVPATLLDWADADATVPTTAISTTTIATSKVLCVNSGGFIVGCSSTVDATGACTCN